MWCFVVWRPGLLVPNSFCARGILRAVKLHFLLLSGPFLGPWYHQSSPWELDGTSVPGNNTMVKGFIVHLPPLSPFIIPCPSLHHLFCPNVLIKILTLHHFFIALKSFPNFTYLLNRYLTDLHAGYFSSTLVKKLFLSVILGWEFCISCLYSLNF